MPTHTGDRYKEEVQGLEDDFGSILKAQPRTYVDKSSGRREIGYIAEEFDEMGITDFNHTVILCCGLCNSPWPLRAYRSDVWRWR